MMLMSEPGSPIKDPTPSHRVEFGPATEADHESVYQSLLHIFHGPDRDAFLGALSDPSYKPEQRLLAKLDGKVASHIHLTERLIRYGTSAIPMNGVMWVGTLPEYRGRGFAAELIRRADDKASETGAAVLALTTAMPRFYRSMGWAICGRQSVAKAPSRTLPSGLDSSAAGPVDWNVRPWRQVELGDLMALYDQNYGTLTGAVIRTEDYWRWIIGRRYAHVIWVACVGEKVHGYAFVKDHKILEMATDPERPEAQTVLLGRVRSEALERAYPEVVANAPPNHPLMETFRTIGGNVIEAEELEGSCSMYRAPDPGLLLRSVLPELSKRVAEAGAGPVELGVVVDDRRWLLHVESDLTSSRVEEDRLGRRYLNLSDAAFVRLVMGHSGTDDSIARDGAEISTATTLEASRLLFPRQAIWRSPLDSATA